MTLEEIEKHAEALRKEGLEVPVPNLNNWQEVLAKYKRMLNDLTVLIRELARHESGVSSDQALKVKDG